MITADKPMTPQGRATQHSRYTRRRQAKQSNQLSPPPKNDCNTNMDTTKHRTITESHK